MRIVHVLPNLSARSGGVSSAVVQLCLGLQESGAEARIVTTDLAGPASASPRVSLSLTDLPGGASALDVQFCGVNWPHRMAYSRDLRAKALASAKWSDVVHIHSLWLYPQWIAYRMAMRAGRPWIVSPEGSLDPWLRRRGLIRKAVASQLWQDAMLTGAAALHFTTQDEALSCYDIAPAVPRHVFPNAVDVGGQGGGDGARFRQKFLQGHDGRIVMHLGRVARVKGIDRLIRSFARVHAALPDAVLVVVGPDDENLSPGLRDLAKTLAIAEAVRFVGMVREHDRRDALAAADVWALASHSENFGVAVIEALAAGCATVVSPAAKCSPDLHAADAALVVDPDAPEFAVAIESLLKDTERRRQLSARGVAFSERFERKQVARLALDVYDEIAGRDSTTRSLRRVA
jgi:glycosyltransferase involved in cell wall biosynthesis